MDEGIKNGTTLYHIVNDNVIEIIVDKIDSNENGIYVYGKNKKGVQYRFILINYSTGKSHFGTEVFTNLKDYEFWKENRIKPESLKEQFANYHHACWSDWMRYLFSSSNKNEDGTVTISKNKVNRWERQMKTNYSDLPEEEKESDRQLANELIDILNEKYEIVNE